MRELREGSRFVLVTQARLGEDTSLIEGLCGVVPGSVDPGLMGIEAGLSATGDIFEAIARHIAAQGRGRIAHPELTIR